MTYQPPPAKPRGRGLPLFVAFVAVLIALLALGTSGWALKKASDAASRAPRATVTVTATPTAPEPPPVTPTVTGPSLPSPTVPLPTGTEPLSPQTVFTPAYQKQVLNAQPGRTCCIGGRNIDLDAPRVDSGGEDILLYSGAPFPQIQPAPGVTTAEADSPGTTPQQCTESLRSSPFIPGGAITLRKGLSFCILTSRAAARDRIESQKMIVLTVAGISTDGVVSLEATAWEVPS